jgi:hypothetical protein
MGLRSLGKRRKLGKALTKFSADVDSYLGDPERRSEMPRSIRNYSEAVERAASDLARRKTRKAELAKVVDSIIS